MSVAFPNSIKSVLLSSLAAKQVANFIEFLNTFLLYLEENTNFCNSLVTSSTSFQRHQGYLMVRLMVQ